ncbi:RNA polymerase sigma-70 factor [Flavitalea flava]
MNPDETITWRSIQQKDGQVFENYYKEHYTYFFLGACKYLKDAGLAGEIVNDVFVTIWEDAEKIHIDSSLKSYIYRAVINRSLNALNKNKRERQLQKELNRLPEPVVELREMEENELKLRLYRAIDQLPEQCQRVFKMSRFEALKQQEIADQLGISIKTVKNHITHALKQLTIALRDWGSIPVIVLAVIKEIFWPGH